MIKYRIPLTPFAEPARILEVDVVGEDAFRWHVGPEALVDGVWEKGHGLSKRSMYWALLDTWEEARNKLLSLAAKRKKHAMDQIRHEDSEIEKIHAMRQKEEQNEEL